MSWKEFKALLQGLGPNTALGRVVSIRAESDPEVIKTFNDSQIKIHNDWKKKQASAVKKEELDDVINMFQNIFRDLAGVHHDK